MWDLEKFNLAATYMGNDAEISSILVLQDGHTFMTCNKKGAIITYDVSYQNYIKKWWPGNKDSAINL